MLGFGLLRHGKSDCYLLVNIGVVMDSFSLYFFINIWNCSCSFYSGFVLLRDVQQLPQPLVLGAEPGHDLLLEHAVLLVHPDGLLHHGGHLHHLLRLVRQHLQVITVLEVLHLWPGRVDQPRHVESVLGHYQLHRILVFFKSCSQFFILLLECPETILTVIILSLP